MTTAMTAINPGKLDTATRTIADRLAASYRKSDTGIGDATPMLKINYDDTSTTAELGEWIVGQRKNQESEIVEQGDRALAFIPIVMRNAYSLYDSKVPANNCNGPLFENFGEVVRGNTHGHICGKKTCPMAAEGKCKAQKVIYGVAITKTSGLVDCVAYFSGVAYMPISDYIATATKMVVGGISTNVPPFAYICQLGSNKKRHGSITYFEPIFTKMAVLSEEKDIVMMEKKRDDILLMIDVKAAEAASKAKPGTPVAGVSKVTIEPETPATVTAAAEPEKIVDPDTIDASFEEIMKGAGSAAPEAKASAMPFEAGGTAPETPISTPAETMSIEEEIKRALAG
jgi:hypothetical protein